MTSEPGPIPILGYIKGSESYWARAVCPQSERKRLRLLPWDVFQNELMRESNVRT
jgi:hypothetical protein